MVNGLGERLHKQRILNRLSQKEVSILLDVSPAIISNYERDERTPSVEMLLSMARLYHCSTDYLLGFNKSPHDSQLDVSMLTEKQAYYLHAFLSEIK